MTFQRVSVIGLGYIGLPTAAVIASRGVDVVGVDVNARAVETINQGRVHIVEPDLDIVVRSVVTAGKLRAVLKPEPADAFLVAVPTPFDANRQPDLSYIEAAAKALAPVLKKGDLVVLESTSPVGATEQMAAWLAAARPDLQFPSLGGAPGDVAIAHCPERVLPGQVLRELVENDRIIGGLTPQCTDRAKALYSLFVQGQLLETDARTAEMAKLAENAFRDVNIAFANELSLICHQLGIDVWELIRMANHHPRVNILQPGTGVGGHCIAVDPWFIVASAPEQARLIRTAREVNDFKPRWVEAQIRAALAAAKGAGKPATLACFGLAFKPNVDDLRESPALHVTEALAATPELTVLAVEPHIEELPASLAGRANVKLVDAATALQQADVVAVLVNHKAYAADLATAAAGGARLLDFVNAVGSAAAAR